MGAPPQLRYASLAGNQQNQRDQGALTEVLKILERWLIEYTLVVILVGEDSSLAGFSTSL